MFYKPRANCLIDWVREISPITERQTFPLLPEWLQQFQVTFKISYWRVVGSAARLRRPLAISHSAEATCSLYPSHGSCKGNWSQEGILAAALQNPKHDFAPPLSQETVYWTLDQRVPRNGEKGCRSWGSGCSWGPQLLERRWGSVRSAARDWAGQAQRRQEWVTG